MEFKILEAETRHFTQPSNNYLVQSQQSDKAININTDYSPEQMMTRFRAVCKQQEVSDGSN